MTIARAYQINLSETKFYHCVSRCVRRGFLFGKDNITGKDYSHRKVWILNRIKFLSNVFAIDICAYAVMSNHTHLVLHVNQDAANKWSDDEVCRRWKLLCPKDYAEFFSPEIKNLSLELITKKILEWRTRLSSISWFMGRLNEKIARMCNMEDHCTGRFWEGRYKCQALLDQGAVLSAMAYVDLNPIRAGLINKLEESEFTSIYERLHGIKNDFDVEINHQIKKNLQNLSQPISLLKFNQNNLNNSPLEFELMDYLKLADETGRIFKENKHGKISKQLTPILERLQINPNNWIDYIQNIEKNFSVAIGNPKSMSSFLQNKNIRGIIKAKVFYKSSA